VPLAQADKIIKIKGLTYEAIKNNGVTLELLSLLLEKGVDLNN
jgi:hypothetical protein